MSTSKHLPSRLPTPEGLVEVVDGVVPSVDPSIPDLTIPRALIAGMQLRYTFQTTEPTELKTVNYSVDRGGAETASGSLALNGGTTVRPQSYQHR